MQAVSEPAPTHPPAACKHTLKVVQGDWLALADSPESTCAGNPNLSHHVRPKQTVSVPCAVCTAHTGSKQLTAVGLLLLGVTWHLMASKHPANTAVSAA